MRKLLAVVVLAAWSPALVAAAQAGAPAKSAERSLRVLLVTGGHAFDQAPFYKIFEDRQDIVCLKSAYPQAAALFKPGLEKEYDVIVMYDMVKAITPEQQKAVVDLLNTGVGLVLLHHDLDANEDWPEFTKIRGGKYFLKPGTVEGKPYPPSTFAEDESVNVLVADREHDITKGLN